jgi:hypothetical protein
VYKIVLGGASKLKFFLIHLASTLMQWEVTSHNIQRIETVVSCWPRSGPRVGSAHVKTSQGAQCTHRRHRVGSTYAGCVHAMIPERQMGRSNGSWTTDPALQIRRPTPSASPCFRHLDISRSIISFALGTISSRSVLVSYAFRRDTLTPPELRSEPDVSARSSVACRLSLP